MPTAPSEETTPVTTPPPGATLHLGGDAWCAPALEPLLVDITTVGEWPGNPRRHDQDNITASVRDLGMWQGIVIQASTGRALLGHGRRQALLDLGATRIPATPYDVDDTRGAAIVARDNQTSDASTNEDRLLLDLLAPLASDADLLALTGYTVDGLEDLERAVANADFAASEHDLTGTPVSDLATPIDLDGDAEKCTVILDPGRRADLYALLADVEWVRNVTDSHGRAAP